jgi:hypothetical protein
MERTVADGSAHPFIRFLQMFLKRQVPISLNKELGRLNWRDYVGFETEINRTTWKTTFVENIFIVLKVYLTLNISVFKSILITP